MRLQIFDENGNRIGTLTNYKDRAITESLDSGDKELSFLYPITGPMTDLLKEECYIRTKTDEFVLKSVDMGDNYNTYTASLNVEGLEAAVFVSGFESVEKTVEECLNTAFVGTGWKVKVYGVTKRRTIRETDSTSAWNILQKALTTYRCECSIDSLSKSVEIYERIGEDKGCYFMEGLNIKKPNKKSDTYDFYTRIYPIGKDGITPAAITGKDYIDNFQYSKKVKPFVWKDERYTDADSLVEDATAKLEELSRPHKEFAVEVKDLAKAKTSESNVYTDILSYEIGDTVTLISKTGRIREKQRIVKLVRYPESPEKNTAEISNASKTFAEIQQEEVDSLSDSIADEVENRKEEDSKTTVRLEKTEQSIEAEVSQRIAENLELATKIASTAHKISMTATGGEKSVGIVIQLYDENGNLIDTTSGAANIEVTGFVKFNDLANAGSTSINGANINTGTISGVTFISNNGTEQVEIEDGNVSFYYNWNKLGRLRTGSFVNADSQLGIMLESISPYALGVGSGGEYYFLINPSSKQVKFYSGVLFSGTCGFNGYSSFGGTANFYSSVNFAERPTCNGENLALKSEIPSVSGYINSVDSASWDTITSNNWVVTSFSLNKRGSSIYVSGNHIKKSLSDQRLKEYLGKLDERYADFYKMLNPIIFKFHDDIPTIKGKHFGLYANEVADALDKANIDRSGLRLVWQSEVDSEAHEDRYINDKTWNLDYDELHALHIYMIQNQQKEIEQLKSDNFALKGEVDILKQRLGKMEEMLNVINSKIN